MKHFLLKNIWLLLPIVSLLTISCSTQDANAVIDEGWDLFAEQNYERALSKFTEAISIDSGNEGGYHGKAWCYLVLNKPVNAIEYFNKAIDKGEQSLDPLAGLAAAYLANENYSEAIAKAEFVLINNDNYFLEYEPAINFEDLRLILAMAYFHEGRLSDSQNQINYLSADNGLNPDNPQSWMVSNQQYSSYAEALMALIDEIDTLYGMP